MKIHLKHSERIVAAIPQYAAGPGWANSPLWVHVVDNANNRYRTECIQPEDQTAAMHTMFRTLEAAHSEMMAAVRMVTERSDE